jgi:hypothetical protein
MRNTAQAQQHSCQYNVTDLGESFAAAARSTVDTARQQVVQDVGAWLQHELENV